MNHPHIATFRPAQKGSQLSLPSLVKRVIRGEDGARVIEGVKPTTTDPHSDIPWGRFIGRDWKAYSKEERTSLIAAKLRKIERDTKKAARSPAPKPKAPKEQPKRYSFREAMSKIADSQIGTEETKSFPDPDDKIRISPEEIRAMTGSSPLQTVKRGGRWVQVGQDNLSAFIEAR